MQIDTDASAEIGIGSRHGTGNVRHIEVNQLWLQDKAYRGEMLLKKAGMAENIAYTFTKPLNAETLGYHVESSSAEGRRDRCRIAPGITEDETKKSSAHEENRSGQEQWLESEVLAGEVVER